MSNLTIEINGVSYPLEKEVYDLIHATSIERDGYRDDSAELRSKMSDGRKYLMQIEQQEITVDDTLEAFGFGRNGLNSF